MGESGSCINRYALNEPVEELSGIASAVLDGSNDDFITGCEKCGYFDAGGRIENGCVIEVWPLKRKEQPVTSQRIPD